MARWVVTADIARPPRVVFDFLETPENAPRYIDGVAECALVEGARKGTGARVVRTTLFGGRTVDMYEATTAYEDGVSYRRMGRMGVARYEATLSVDDAGDGRARVTLDVTFEPAGVSGWLVWPIFLVQMRGRYERTLRAAKRVLEEDAHRAYRSPG